MRAPTLILILMLCVGSLAAASPSVTAHVSQQDVREVTAVIGTATQEPILAISPVYKRQPVRGSIAVKEVELGSFKDGKVQTKPIVMYERTDRVAVRTGSEQNLTGSSYVVQRIGTKWKILSKGSWIH
jgi:hypothetical protein